MSTLMSEKGAIDLKTPKSLLTNKYGEEAKLIFDLEDQGGELCSLRYDLTVPFARFLAMNKNIKNLKRYHIGKVYRRDQPIMSRGRFREFYQCDFDIAGQHELMLADAEVVAVMNDVLKRLSIGEFVIRINHRKLLDGMFEACGVPSANFRSICSAIDKLDKMEWSEVKRELTQTRNIASEVADRIGEYVSMRGVPTDVLPKLVSDPILGKSAAAQQGLQELACLFEFIQMTAPEAPVILDLSLARGLDYYTGMITEAVLTCSDDYNFVGSIAGGGRYDTLVQSLTNSGHSISCVGISIGIERIFAILEAKNKNTPKTVPTQVLVASMGNPHFADRLRICAMLRTANISTETLLKRRTRPLDIFEHAEKNHIPLLIVFGQDELDKDMVRIKRAHDRDDKGQLVPISSLVDTIRSRLAVS